MCTVKGLTWGVSHETEYDLSEKQNSYSDTNTFNDDKKTYWKITGEANCFSDGMLSPVNLSWHESTFPYLSHASCLKQGQAWKRSSYLTKTKFFVFTFSSHNIFNFLPFTLIQLSKFVMQMQQRLSWPKALARTKLHSWYWVAKLYRKSLHSHSGSIRWAATGLISPAEAVTALSLGASAQLSC